MSFDAKKQNQLIIEKRSELAKEHREMMAAQLAADQKKHKDGYVPDVTFKRPSQELMDQIKQRNDAKEKRYKEERDAAYKRSVARAKGGRRTRRHKHSNKKHRSKSNKKKRMSRRR
jgi:hypothetical protein